MQRLAEQEAGRAVATGPPSASASPTDHLIGMPAQPGSTPSGGGTDGNIYAGLVAKRRISAKRDCYTTCCMIFFPVCLVWMALGILRISNRIIDVGDPLILYPADVLKSPNQLDGRALILPEADPALGWSTQLQQDGWMPSAEVPSDAASLKFPAVLTNVSQVR